MSNLELERLVWRWEYGAFPGERLIYLLKEETRTLVTEVEGLRGKRSIIREWQPQLLQDFDEAKSQANRSLDQRACWMALQQIILARKALQAMAELLEAEAGMRTVSEALQRLYALAHVASLRQLPTLSSLAQMLDLVRQFLRERQYRQTLFTAELCLKEIRTLEHREAGTAMHSQKLAERLAALQRICAETQPFAPRQTEDWQANGALHALQTCLQQGFSHFVERLTADLETQLAARRLFYESYQRVLQIGPPRMASNLNQTLQELVRQQSWHAALQHLQQNTLRACEEELRQTDLRAQHLALHLRVPAGPRTHA